jgi:predicted PurR-regulated permease PerM
MKVIKFLFKLLWPVLKIAGIAYLILFIVFYFDLDGKLLYTVVEPNLARRYDKMPRPDNTQTPYGKTEPFEK